MDSLSLQESVPTKKTLILQKSAIILFTLGLILSIFPGWLCFWITFGCVLIATALLIPISSNNVTRMCTIALLVLNIFRFSRTVVYMNVEDRTKYIFMFIIEAIYLIGCLYALSLILYHNKKKVDDDSRSWFYIFMSVLLFKVVMENIGANDTIIPMYFCNFYGLPLLLIQMFYWVIKMFVLIALVNIIKSGVYNGYKEQVVPCYFSQYIWVNISIVIFSYLFMRWIVGLINLHSDEITDYIHSFL